MLSKKVRNRFSYIKKLINNEDDIKVLVDMFYYNQKAVDYVNKINKDYFMNSYYNLTTIDFLLMIDDAENIEDLHLNLYKEYEESYAESIYQSFVDCLERDLLKN